MPTMATCRQGILGDMEAQGIQYVDCYCVDNALARVGDPTFVGHCALSNADCGELSLISL